MLESYKGLTTSVDFKDVKPEYFKVLRFPGMTKSNGYDIMFTGPGESGLYYDPPIIAPTFRLTELNHCDGFSTISDREFNTLNTILVSCMKQISVTPEKYKEKQKIQNPRKSNDIGFRFNGIELINDQVIFQCAFVKLV